MNIFLFDFDAQKSAQAYPFDYLNKMPLEYCQLMCTAHRVINGIQYTEQTKNGRSIKRWRLEDPICPELDQVLYKATHVNHPCAIWVRESHNNYMYLYDLYLECLDEYKRRRGKDHKCSELEQYLGFSPWERQGGSIRLDWNDPIDYPLVMPDQYRQIDAVAAYRSYFINEKAHLAYWENGAQPPEWFEGTPLTKEQYNDIKKRRRERR